MKSSSWGIDGSRLSPGRRPKVYVNSDSFTASFAGETINDRGCRGTGAPATAAALTLLHRDDARRDIGDYRVAAALASAATGGPLSGRGAILGLVAAPGAWLLLEAAACRLADRADHRDLRRERVRDPAVRTAAARRHGDLRLWGRRPTL